MIEKLIVLEDIDPVIFYGNGFCIAGDLGIIVCQSDLCVNCLLYTSDAADEL